MSRGLRGAAGVEVVGEAPERDVGGGEGGGAGIAGEDAQLAGREKDKGGGDGEEEHGIEGGKDAAGAALIEAQVAEGAGADRGVDWPPMR